jgi:parallel beta-helix repeat protein
MSLRSPAATFLRIGGIRGHARKGTARLARALILAAVVAGLLIPGAHSAGTTLFVDASNPNCSNSGTGSVAQPFCMISASGSKVVPGTTVQVAAGNYPEKVSVKSGTADARVLYTAAPGATVTVGSGQPSGFVASAKNYVTINGFNVTQTNGHGIDISSGSTNVVVSNSNVSYSGQPQSGQTKYGIRVSGASDCIIKGNAVHHNSDSGIAVVGSSARIQVLNNNTYENARGYQRAAAGIRVADASDNTIAGNITHDNEDTGVESYPGAVNTLIYNNVSYDNGDHGFDNFGTTNQRIIGNTAYHNVTAGINVEGNSSGAVVENNISVDNGIGSPRTHSDIRIERGSTTGAVVDYNIVWLTANDVLYVWDSQNYSTLAAFRAASGQGAHAIWADPKWRDLGARDFHLTFASPGVDSADSGASGQAASDVEGTERIDDPFVADTGAGPRSYDDRGAYELAAADMDVAPTARLTLTPTSGVFPLTVQADASGSTDPDATPISTYRFNWGDGAVTGPQAQPTASHTYTTAGTYTVTVTVTDTAGKTATTTAQEVVQDLAPTANLRLTPALGNLPLQVTADASASGDPDPTPIASYRFDFGDGTVVGPQSEATAPHTYTTKGTYTVTLTVTDTAGNASTATATVQVAGDEPTVSLVVTPASGTAPLTVTADASGSWDTDATPIATYSFAWGDGTSTPDQAQPTATHTYTSTGSQTVTVTVTDTGGASSTATASVTVYDAPPTAALNVSPPSGASPLNVTADASASSDPDTTPVATYNFDFGDGTLTGPQSSAIANHTYGTDGTFTVTVTVTDTAGKTGSTTKQVVIGAPTAALSVTPSSGITPVAVTADASGSSDPGPTPIASYTFDFGDGAVVGPQADATATHTYTTGGTFTVKVTVKDSIDLTSTATQQVTITRNLISNSGFEANLTGWNTSGSDPGIALAQSTASAHSGSTSALLTNTSAAPASCLLNDSPNWVLTTTAATYTATLWVRADTPGATLNLRLREFAGGPLVGSALKQVTLTTSWQQVSISYTAAAGSTLDYNAYVVKAAPGQCFYADDAAITNG